MNPIVLIPARMASTRLPGKPLADICGTPMIVHVFRRALEADIGPVAVATDADEIAAAVRDAGGTCIMTRSDHSSGSDRIHEALLKTDPDGRHDVIVNVQGDLPQIEPRLISAVLKPFETDSVDISTLAAEITVDGEKTNPNVVKVVGTPVAANRLRALYFTRATAPSGEGPLYHHIGLYAFRRRALERFVALPPGVLERRERLEQLRALEAGMRIDIELVDTVPFGVDAPDDLVRARRMLSGEAGEFVNLKRDSDRRDRKEMSSKKIVFQGEPGANSHISCRNAYPDYDPVPRATFEDCFQAIEAGDADLGMIPIENSLAGRVADIHHLLPTSGLSIIGEYFLPVSHNLLGLKGTSIADLEVVQSHVMALGACREFLRKSGLRTESAADTAGSARHVAELGDRKRGAIATPLAAEIYGLDILAADIADADHNTTRFVVLSRDAKWPKAGDGPMITSFVFRVRNVPAALYKGLGGFATNNVNMTKLESYQLGGQFFATQFYADIEGHPDDHNVALALEELGFFSAELRIVGVYPASPFRENIAEPEENRDLRPSPKI